MFLDSSLMTPNLFGWPGVVALLAVLVLGTLLYRLERHAGNDVKKALRFGRRGALGMMALALLALVVAFLIALGTNSPIGAGLALLAMPMVVAITGATTFIGVFSVTGAIVAIRDVGPGRRAALFLTPLLLLGLVAAAQRWSHSIRTEIEDPATSNERLAEISLGLAARLDWRIERTAASSERLSPEILTRLAQSRREGTRMSVAWNPATPSKVIEALTRDPSPRVRAELARNRAATPDLLETLSTDRAVIVRMKVGRSQKAPPALLGHLATDPSANVRVTVAGNPRTPLSVLEALSEDGAEANPFYPYDNHMETSGLCFRYSVRSEVASNASAPPELLTRLAREEGCSLRRSVAGNPAAPIEVLEALEGATESAVSIPARQTLRKLRADATED